MTPPTPVSVVLAGGGTAGHISPLLAIADAITDLAPGTRITAVGTESGMETRLVPAAGYDLETIDRVPLPRRPSTDLLKLPYRLAGAIRQALRILDTVRPSVVVGVGGYVAAPLYLAAFLRRVPLVIHEANARPGIANRLGARIAGTVAVAFRDTRLPKAQWVGMPMRRAIAGLDRATARESARRALGLDPARPTLIITGGSSGALSINRAAAAAAPGLCAEGIQILHITGRGKTITASDGSPLTLPGYHQLEYVDDMEAVYAAADLLVARAGAATVCEISAVGLPSILVPLAHGNGEQALNAAALTADGGAVLISDADLTPARLSSEVLTLLKEPAALDRMARAAAAQGIRDADRTMARLVLDAAGASS
ncbi:undecaprenyldiphospho-muramoylpentapeptide beta-N-acetylglucosaminyltransferase [Arthrobacter crusticola]|uniref:UDP-N-acetylglucosamine--N-acetylmuramyl-(pentapeptide) pyrophosphoryl-undecaprenol N-acetylglucosamine transferase n=1 Tax=Arthrobacter crusticola TaxID=2547960 RepID=A0A4R5TS63_9MICC|nr:undecaprenyldiphospho-muramoylpentapeptide beta-N-acetylglucosaminyltransferase [Arthrobacter crusticola]TDK24187.1 undecaprenyldiphospho-muramoylpentapeptide beta-N-acetylglucosaminyltransferase [Arthrobacter crusticola]